MLSNYSFTVTIPKFKNVWWKKQDDAGHEYNQKFQFGKMAFWKQEMYFADLVEIARISIGLQEFALPIAWVVEVHPQDPSRYHMHGTFYEITVDKMAEIRKDWAEKIGIKSEKQIRDCIFINKLDSPYAWDQYLIKDQVHYDLDDLDIVDDDVVEYKFKGKKNLI